MDCIVILEPVNYKGKVMVFLFFFFPFALMLVSFSIRIIRNSEKIQNWRVSNKGYPAFQISLSRGYVNMAIHCHAERRETYQGI